MQYFAAGAVILFSGRWILRGYGESPRSPRRKWAFPPASLPVLAGLPSTFPLLCFVFCHVLFWVFLRFFVNSPAICMCFSRDSLHKSREIYIQIAGKIDTDCGKTNKNDGVSWCKGLQKSGKVRIFVAVSPDHSQKPVLRKKTRKTEKLCKPTTIDAAITFSFSWFFFCSGDIP